MVLTGRVSASHATLERRIGSGRWVRVSDITRGLYHRTVLPPAGKTVSYRVGASKLVAVRSTLCTPLSSPGSTSAWFNLRRGRTPVVATNWGRLICSAAPNSSITLASMFIFGGSASTDALLADLRAVAAYRGAHVHVLVQKSQYPTRPTKDQWTWQQFTHAFAFADIRACDRGCTVAGPGRARACTRSS